MALANGFTTAGVSVVKVAVAAVILASVSGLVAWGLWNFSQRDLQPTEPVVVASVPQVNPKADPVPVAKQPKSAEPAPNPPKLRDEQKISAWQRDKFKWQPVDADRVRPVTFAVTVPAGHRFVTVAVDDVKGVRVRTRGGAPFIAANETHVFLGMPAHGGSALVRMDPTTGREAPFASGKIDIPLPGKATGMAATKDTVAISIGSKNLIVLHSTKTGDKEKELAVTAPGKLAFTPDGATLVGVSGKELFRVEVGSGKVATFLPEGVKLPVAVAVSPGGGLYRPGNESTGPTG